MLRHLYAAEAYPSRSAIDVVGAMQMEDENIKSELALLDLKNKQTPEISGKY